MRNPWHRLAVLAGLLGLVAPAESRAQQGAPGAIAVTVTDSATRRPVEAARVFLAGTNVGGQTSVDGKVTIRPVQAGDYVVRVLRVGYAENTRRVTVAAGQTATLRDRPLRREPQPRGRRHHGHR